MRKTKKERERVEGLIHAKKLKVEALSVSGI